MKSLLLALLVSVSVGTWSYTKLQNHTGYGNTKTTISGALAVGIIAFIVVFTIGSFVIFRSN